MAVCACKCLNIILESDNLEDISDIEKLELSSAEQRDLFFSEKLSSCLASSLQCRVIQPALMGRRIADHITFAACLACGQTTHAILHEKNIVLINKSMQTTEEEINNLKRSSNFSPVFNLLVPEVTNDIEMKENIDTSNQMFSERNGSQPSIQLIGTLKKQLNTTLQSHLEEIEETVRQFKEQKYAEYEAYRERAHRDHQILSSIVSKTNTDVGKDSLANMSNLENEPSSPLTSIQRRRLSSIKDSRKIPHVRQASAQIPHEEDSLDAEDIFDLEGMDNRNNIASDQDDYYSDDGSNDEGIHIGRPRGGRAHADFARSVPINMPRFGNERPTARDMDDYEETQDIAASIKALARSVHGDVFELPRPRFSTQI